MNEFYTSFGRALQELPHFREIVCSKCGATIRFHTLDIYADCPACGHRVKMRVGQGTDELFDVIDDVLLWADTDEAWEALNKRRRLLLASLRPDSSSGISDT